MSGLRCFDEEKYSALIHSEKRGLASHRERWPTDREKKLRNGMRKIQTKRHVALRLEAVRSRYLADSASEVVKAVKQANPADPIQNLYFLSLRHA